MRPVGVVAGSTVPAGPFRVETISDYQSFVKLEWIWDRLVEEAGIDHPFLSYEWVRTWWECFGAGKELHTLVVKAGDETIGIAPLMLSRERMCGLKVRRLEFIQDVHTPRSDFIIARWPEEAYRAIWKAILDRKGFWDVLLLCELPAGSRTLEEIPRFATEDGCLLGLWRSVDSPYVPFVGGWDGYFKRLSRNHRAKVRKGLNRLSLLGRVQLEMISSGPQLGSTVDEGLRIEAAGWKGKAGTAILCRPELQRFYRTFAQRAAQSGALRLLFLTVGHARIAFAYALSHKNKLYVLKAGFDPQYARYSPYNLLCYLVFRDGFARGLAEYEFLGSNEDWKLDWAKQTKPHSWIFVFPNVLRGRLLHYAKFRVIPRLQRYRAYQVLRNCLVEWRRRPKPFTERREDGQRQSEEVLWTLRE